MQGVEGHRDSAGSGGVEGHRDSAGSGRRGIENRDSGGVEEWRGIEIVEETRGIEIVQGVKVT